MIGRAILDHVPPIFKLKSFDQVASNYGGPNASKSFKKNMSHLNNSFKQIAHAHLHTAMREKEVLPNETQVNFKQDMDVLLCEIIRLSK
jgi:plasmid rolling circle replication initiator protein Rep